MALIESFQILRILSQRNTEPLDLKFETTKFAAACARIDRLKGGAPPRIRPDLLPIWNKMKETNQLDLLSDSELRNMCWVPEVVNDPQFLELLWKRKKKLGRSLIKGICYSIVTAWKSFLSSPEKIQKYKKIVEELNSSSILSHCSPYVFAPDGPSKMSDELLKRRVKPSDLLMEKFGIVFSGNDYLTQVLTESAKHGFEILTNGRPEDVDWYFDVILSALTKEQLYQPLGDLVAKVDELQNEAAKERILEFILNHPNLGDPRLPGFEANWHITSQLAVTLMEWLSQGDIGFFFEMFFQNRNDSQGRKRFWMDYAHCVRGTRVIVSAADSKRYFSKINEFKQKNQQTRLLASLNGAGDLGTAFMMDFGTLKVVEFSQSGNACYFYSQNSNFQFNNRNLFWNTEKFSVSDLKNQEVCVERMSHISNWEVKFSMFLARNGIRAVRRGRG